MPSQATPVNNGVLFSHLQLIDLYTFILGVIAQTSPKFRSKYTHMDFLPNITQTSPTVS